MNGLTELEQAYRATGRRLTRQRRLLLKVLEESDSHLDAESLRDRVRVHDPEISLATVYRALAALKEVGLVEEHRLGEEHSHYESVRDEPHYHFSCLRCGSVTEFDTPLVEQIKHKLSEQKGVRVTSAHLHLSGYCAECRNTEETDNNVE